jgi:uncharacterized protein YecE (DUF72 family)
MVKPVHKTVDEYVAVAVRVGTAGWAIPRDQRDAFPADGSVLERYAGRFSCVEINSSFYRPHRASTYARWASSVPESFRFSVKMPKEITHKRKLDDCVALLDAFVAETSELGTKLGVYVVQLAPSLAFDAAVAAAFFKSVRERYNGGLACEPRHATWCTDEASKVLKHYSVTRIGADPVLFQNARISDPNGGFAYYRWHGSPRTYYSSYEQERLIEFSRTVHHARATDVWCIFDNTAAGYAVENALVLSRLVSAERVGNPLRNVSEA